MEFLADSACNPFDMQPPCDAFVAGYGATDADFHIVGDHPGIHGGLSSGIPFTDRPWSDRFFDALVRGGLIDDVDLDAGHARTLQVYLSYLHLCDPGPEPPSEESYAELEPYFDAELRAITAHVLLPVGQRATRHVLQNYTAIDADRAAEMDDLHATELRGSGWLVVPITDPGEWSDDDEAALVERLQLLLASDYTQLSDLSRFLPDSDPYFVR